MRKSLILALTAIGGGVGLRGGSNRSRHRPQHGRLVHLALARVIDSGCAKAIRPLQAWKLSACSAPRHSINVTSAIPRSGCRSRVAICARSVRAGSQSRSLRVATRLCRRVWRRFRFRAVAALAS